MFERNGARALLMLVASFLIPACGSSPSVTPSPGPNPPPPPVPSVSGVSPLVARVGEEIKIQGAALGANQGTSTVTVGGAAAVVNLWSDAEVRVQVPAAALSGVVELVVGTTTLNPGTLTILWPQVNPQNVAVSAGSGDQDFAEAVADGSGGAIVAWRDSRSGTLDIYAQRFSTAGAAMWTAGGVAVCSAAGDQDNPQLISDGAGGAVIVWQDNRSGTLDIYAQRLNAAGAAQWTSDGVGVCTVGGPQDYPNLVADGSGGVVIIWRDTRSGQIHLYAQRLNSNGAAQWTAGGVAFQTAGAVDAWTPRLIGDGSGGAIAVWDDIRAGEFDVYAQRLDGATGAPQWTANGVKVGGAASSQGRPQVVPDGSGGAVMAWFDYRSGNSDIYAQRINGSGLPQWTADGVPVCTAVDDQDFVQMIPSGSGGAILVWHDQRLGAGNHDLYAQRLDGGGAVQWASDGVVVSGAGNHQAYARICSDGAGGVVAAWEDSRSGVYDVYAQRLNSSGVAQWAANGIAVCSAAGGQLDARVVPDGTGGGIFVWRDARSGVDVYAQKVIGTGQQ